MKKYIYILTLISIFSLISNNTYSQLFGNIIADEITDKVADKVADKVVDKIEQNWEEDQTGNKTLPKDYTLNPVGFGSGLVMYYKGIVTQLSKDSLHKSDVGMEMKIYINPNKGSRSETIIEVPLIRDFNTATIYNYNQPNQIVYLNNNKHTYSIESINNSKKENITYSFTKMGEEELFGLSCKRLKLTSKITSEDGNIIGTDTFFVWTTKDLPKYEMMSGIYAKNNHFGTHSLWQKLHKEDCDGFMVKMVSKTKKGKIIMQMTEIQKVNVSASLLKIPSNYKETSQSNIKD